MNSLLNILFIGQQGNAMDPILQPLGNITYADNFTGQEKYDLVALDGSQFNGNFPGLLSTVINAGSSIGVINISAEQVSAVSALTGISPSRKSLGVLAGSSTIGESGRIWQVRYLPDYPANVMDVARKGGMDPQALINGFITAGISSHFTSLSQLKDSGPPPSNNLIPVSYAQVPFSIVNLPPKNISYAVSNMKNMSSLSLTFSAQLYCYNENASGNNDFIVIAITQLYNIAYGNPVSYSKFDMPSCGNCSFNYGWDQYFDYTLTLVAASPGTPPVPFTSGLTVYDSSPAPVTHGGTSLLDTIGVPNPFTIYMQVNNQGTPMGINFPAAYINTITTPTVTNFDVTSKDNQAAATAGVDFNTPETGYVGGKSPLVTNFEVASIFRFNNSLVQNNSLPVVFTFNINMAMKQNYTTMVSCGDNPGWPQVTTTNGGGIQSFPTDTLDLVALTKEQNPPH